MSSLRGARVRLRHTMSRIMRQLNELPPVPQSGRGQPSLDGLPFYLPGQSPRARAAALQEAARVPPVKVGSRRVTPAAGSRPASRMVTPRTADVSYLADSPDHRPGGGWNRPPLPDWEGSQDDFQRFKRSIEAKRTVKDLPPQPPPPSTRFDSLAIPTRPSTRATTAVSQGAADVPIAEPMVETPWTARGYTQNEVAMMLFPGDRTISSLGHAPRASAAGGAHKAPPAPTPAPPQPFARPLTAIDLYGPGCEPQPSGRARALTLATRLARDAGPHGQAGPNGAPMLAALSERAAAALRVPTDAGDEESLLQSHAAIRQLETSEVAPHVEALDAGYRELSRQVGSHCTEQAMIIEYLRRQHLSTAACARALLGRLQHAVGLYEELREAMDGSLLQRFEDSLGDALRASMEVPSAPAGMAAALAPVDAPAAAALAAAPAVAAAPTPAVAPAQQAAAPALEAAMAPATARAALSSAAPAPAPVRAPAPAPMLTEAAPAAAPMAAAVVAFARAPVASSVRPAPAEAAEEVLFEPAAEPQPHANSSRRSSSAQIVGDRLSAPASARPDIA